MQPCTLFWCILTAAQRDLSRIRCIKLCCEVVDNGLKGEHNYKHSRWQLGMNNRRDKEHMSIA